MVLIRGLSCLFVAIIFSVANSSNTVLSQSAHHEKFLSALKENGHFDVAEDYLKRAENSQWLDENQKAKLPLQKAALSYAQAGTLRNKTESANQRTQAETFAKQFLQNARNFESKLEALDLLRQIEEEKIGQILRAAKLDRSTIWQNPAEAGKARTHFQNASNYYHQSVDVLRQHLKSIRGSRNPKVHTNSKIKQWRRSFLRFRVLKHAHLENVANTYAKGDNKRKVLLEKLVASYEDLAKKYYREPPFNEYFRAYKGRCLARLGQWEKGAREIEDVLLRTEPSFWPLQLSVIPEAIDCWTNQTPPAIEVAIVHLNNLNNRTPKNQQNAADGQLAVFYLAKMIRKKHDLLNAKSKPNSTERKEIKVTARKSEELLRSISQSKNKAGKLARDLIVSFGGKVEGPKAGPPETFNEALKRATQKFRSTVADFKRTSKAPEAPADLIQSVDQTLSALELATKMIGQETSASDKNLIRYYRCYCFWMKRRYQETALMGEFMLGRFPNQSGTSESVALATQAYHRLILEGQKAKQDVSFEQNRLSELCKQVLERWPDSSAAGDVSFLLLSAAIGQKNNQDIRRAADQIPNTHPKYSSGQLYSGLAIYNQSIALNKELKQKTAAKTINQDETKKQQRLIQSLQEEASGRFQKSFQTLSTTPTAQHYDAAYKLAGHLNSQKKYTEAFSLLNNPPLSTFQRIKNDPNFKLTPALKILLIRNGLLSQLSDGLQTGKVEESLNETDRLVKLVRSIDASKPDAARFLRSTETLILVRLGQMAKVTTNSKQRAQLADACLSYFAEMPKTQKDFRILGTLGSTLSSISESLTSDQGKRKRQLNQLASSCYDRCIKLAGATDDGKKYLLQFRLGKATTLRGGGQYREAAKEIESILKQNSRLAPAQIEASKIYQKWGEQTRNASYIVTAMKGGLEVKQRRKKRNLMQGWQAIAQSTIGNKESSELFYTAFIGLAECKLAYGSIKGNRKFYSSVIKQIKKEKARNSDLGGPGFKKKLDDVARRAQKLLGLSPSGLADL